MTDAGFPRGGDEAQVATTASFEGLADEWDDLALRTGAPPFARPGWIRAWWPAFGKGELCILTSRRDGELSAVLPLGRHRGALRSCSNVHSPLFDGVCADNESLQELLATALRETRRQELRRRRRRLAEQGEINFEVLDGTGDLEACLEEFFRLEASGWKG